MVVMDSFFFWWFKYGFGQFHPSSFLLIKNWRVSIFVKDFFLGTMDGGQLQFPRQSYQGPIWVCVWHPGLEIRREGQDKRARSKVRRYEKNTQKSAQKSTQKSYVAKKREKKFFFTQKSCYMTVVRRRRGQFFFFYWIWGQQFVACG